MTIVTNKLECMIESSRYLVIASASLPTRSVNDNKLLTIDQRARLTHDRYEWEEVLGYYAPQGFEDSTAITCNDALDLLNVIDITLHSRYKQACVFIWDSKDAYAYLLYASDTLFPVVLNGTLRALSPDDATPESYTCYGGKIYAVL